MVPLAKQISGECRVWNAQHQEWGHKEGRRLPDPQAEDMGCKEAAHEVLRQALTIIQDQWQHGDLTCQQCQFFFFSSSPFFGTNPKLSSFGLCWAKAGAAVLSQQPCPECLGAKRGPWAAGSRKLRKLQDLSMTGSWTNRTSSVGELSLTRKCDGYSWFIFSPVGWLNISWSYQGFGGISAGQLGMRCRGPQRGR